MAVHKKFKIMMIILVSCEIKAKNKITLIVDLLPLAKRKALNIAIQ